MAKLHISRTHTLGLPRARELASLWVGQAEQSYGMTCTYPAGEAPDCVQFARSGVSGTLRVSADCFELQATLGFLLGAYKDRIEAEVTKNLDALLATPPAQAG